MSPKYPGTQGEQSTMPNPGALSKKSKRRSSTAATTYMTAILLLATIISNSAPAADPEADSTRRAISEKIKAQIIKPASVPKHVAATIDIAVRDDGYTKLNVIRKNSGN